MPKLKMWQVDAFASRPFTGNPAAIVPLEKWLDVGVMQAIANENNLSETAFFAPVSKGKYELRWFTPTDEVDLCGHATMASAWLIFEKLAPNLESVSFRTQKSGILTVDKSADGNHRMSLPADPVGGFMAPQSLLDGISSALQVPPPKQIYSGRMFVAVWDDPAIIASIRGIGQLQDVLAAVNVWGLICTAPGTGDIDFVSRFFAPLKGVPEDPVTGSAHCALTPLWAGKLEKKILRARQISARGGDLICEDAGDRTILSGTSSLYLEGEITIP